MNYEIIFFDGTFNYRIDEEGILVIVTDELDENGNAREVHAIGPDEMEPFIEWLKDESRRKAKLRKDEQA